MSIEGRAVYRNLSGGSPRPATIALDLRGLAIRGLDGSDIAAWPFVSLVRLPPGRAQLVLSAGGETGRVEITDAPTAAAFDAALKTIPEAGSLVIPRSYAGPAIAAGILAAAVIGAVWWVLSVAGDLVAPMVPDPALRSLDSTALPAVIARIGTTPDGRCETPEGRAALDRLVDRLVDAGGMRETTLEVAVWRSPVADAVSLPGGTVALTSGLLASSADADAFAALLARELGHVHLRHDLRALFAAGGPSVAVALLTGGSIQPSLVATTVAAGPGSAAIVEADRFAVDAVAAAGGRPAALADALRALAASPATAPTLLAVEPVDEARLTAIVRRSEDRAPRPGPLITAEDFAAIRAICGVS